MRVLFMEDFDAEWHARLLGLQSCLSSAIVEEILALALWCNYFLDT